MSWKKAEKDWKGFGGTCGTNTKSISVHYENKLTKNIRPTDI